MKYQFEGTCLYCGKKVWSNHAEWDPGHFGNPCGWFMECPYCYYTMEVKDLEAENTPCEHGDL